MHCIYCISDSRAECLQHFFFCLKLKSNFSPVYRLLHAMCLYTALACPGFPFSTKLTGRTSASDKRAL